MHFKSVIFFFLMGIALTACGVISRAVMANTEVDLVVHGGPLFIEAPSKVSLGRVAVAEHDVVVHGAVPEVKVVDLRGTAEGWSASMRSTALGIAGTSIKKEKIATGEASSSSEKHLVVEGVYDGLNSGQPGEFMIHIDQVASDRNALPVSVTVTKPDSAKVTLPVIKNAVSINGLIIFFQSENVRYAVGDTFRLTVDYFPAVPMHTNLTMEPTPPFFGLGTYFFKDEFDWEVHKKALPGTYEAVLTYSIH